jgi:hypothetical protein
LLCQERRSFRLQRLQSVSCRCLPTNKQQANFLLLLLLLLQELSSQLLQMTKQHFQIQLTLQLHRKSQYCLILLEFQQMQQLLLLLWHQQCCKVLRQQHLPQQSLQSCTQQQRETAGNHHQHWPLVLQDCMAVAADLLLQLVP